MKKNNKKGFTLVELIAVIAILSILIMMALPESLKLFNQGKKSAFITQAQAIYKAAEESYISQQIPGEGGPIVSNFCKGSSNGTTLNISDNDALQYKVKFNNEGEIVYLEVGDDTYHFKKDNVMSNTKILLSDIKNPDKDKVTVTCE